MQSILTEFRKGLSSVGWIGFDLIAAIEADDDDDAKDGLAAVGGFGARVGLGAVVGLGEMFGLGAMVGLGFGDGFSIYGFSVAKFRKSSLRFLFRTEITRYKD